MAESSTPTPKKAKKKHGITTPPPARAIPYTVVVTWPKKGGA